MFPSRRSLFVHAGLGLATAGVFLVDMTVPLGLAVPFLYLLVALLAIGARVEKRMLIAIAALCTLLAVVKLIAPPADGVLRFGQGNRLIFTVLMWSAVGLELMRRQVETKLKAERLKISRDLEKLIEERTEALRRANADLHKEVAERKVAERTIRDYADRLQALANQLVEAQELERGNLATELHDRIGQNLSALNINLGMHLAQLTAQLPSEAVAPARARIKDSLELVERTAEIVRGVMEELHPALLDQYGLAAALRWYGEEYSRRTGIQVAVEATELFPRLRSKVELTLFRIVQEALTNVAKHAQARRVAISLQRRVSGVDLEFADDGIGMEQDRAGGRPIGSGWGLSIMAERARAIGADCRIESVFRGGTRIVVNIADGLWELEHGHQGTDS